MATYKLRIDRWQPARLNALMNCHPKTRGRLKKADRNLVGGYALMNRFPLATTRRRVDLHITLGPRQKEGDEGNWWKSVEDALVQARLLIDDNRRWYQRGTVTFDRGPERATVIILTELGGENATQSPTCTGMFEPDEK